MGYRSTRVSNELGARNVRSARDAMTVGLCLSLSVSVAIAVALVIARHVAGRLFTDDDDVVAYVANICPLLALSICLDATQTILSGKSIIITATTNALHPRPRPQ